MKWAKKDEYHATRGKQTVSKNMVNGVPVYGLWIRDKAIKYSRDKDEIFKLADRMK